MSCAAVALGLAAPLTVAPAATAGTAAPVVTSLSRHASPVDGGVSLTIHGRGLSGVNIVDFGSSETGQIRHLSPTAIRVRVPYGRPGLVNVRVRGLGTISARNVHTRFRYVPTPTVSAVSRQAGLVEGGQRIWLRGHDFLQVRAVRFGTKPGTRLHVISPSLLWITTPAHAAGTTALTVTTAFGTSATDGYRFAFGYRPVVTAIGPAWGATSGGTQLDITGAHFAGYLSVLVDGKHVQWSSYGTRDLTTDMPKHAVGVVHVQVANEYGTSPATSADLFRYLPPERRQWSSSQLVDPSLGFPLAESCAEHLCAFVDGFGGLFTKPTTGAAWHEDVAPRVGGTVWYFVSCVSDQLCFASGTRGAVSRFDGRSWSTPTVIPDVGYLFALSCVSETQCHAVTVAGADVVWNGSTWQVVHDRGAPLVEAMRCSSVDSCDAIDNLGYSYAYAAGTWSRTGTVSEHGIVSASCTIDECAAAATDGTTFVLGSSWSATAPAPIVITQLACAGDDSCTGIDAHGNTAVFAGGTWTAGPTATPSTYQRIGCRSRDSCEWVDDDGYTASLEGGVASEPTSTDPSQGGPTSVACAQTRCVLLDHLGNVFTRAGNGDWSQPTKLGRHGTAVSCATAQWCVVIADGRTFVYDGVRWTDTASATGIATLSCPATNYCLGGGAGTLYGFDGAAWSATKQIGQNLSALTCSSAGHCLAVGRTGGQYRLTGTTWTTLKGAPRLAADDMQAAVACPTDQVCFVADYSGAVTQLRGSTWIPTTHVRDYAQTLACRSATSCLTVGPQGSSTFDGTTWTAPAPVARAPFNNLPWRLATDVAVDSGKWLVTSLGYVVESA